jgi:hypothetical protein
MPFEAHPPSQLIAFVLCAERLLLRSCHSSELGFVEKTMESEIAERRGTHRLPLELPVSLRMTQAGHLEITGTSRDISTDGIYLWTESDIVEGSDVELLVTLPTEDDRVAITVRGRIVRVEKLHAGAAAGVAIAFRQLEVERPTVRRNCAPAQES